MFDQHSTKDDRQEILQRAMDVIVRGLHDTDTHIGQSNFLNANDSLS